MITRRVAAVALAAVTSATVAVFAALPSAGAAPAFAQWAGLAGGPGYAHLAYSSISITGNANPAGLSSPTAYLPAPCWVEPRFTGANSYHKGDPQPSPNGDADSYWWWFASQQPALYGVLGRVPGLKQAVNRVFQTKQGGNGWWWVPAWVNSGVNGYACATGLVRTLNFSAQYLNYLPPQTGGGDTPGHTIDGHILADLARAALALPSINVHTNPAAGTPDDVNLPVWVWVTYNGPRSPADTASVPLPGGGVLSATVATSLPQVSLSVSSPAQAQVHSQCGAAGTPYRGNASATPLCGVTFLAPSTRGPYTITVTARWTVTWSDTTGDRGTFATPPWPAPVQTGTVSVTVREVQSVNGPTPGP